MKEEELNLRRQEIAKLTKAREAIQKKFHQMEDQKGEAEVQRETLKTQLSVMERELELFRKQAETERKAAEELVRERDMLNKNLIKVTDATGKQQSLMKLQEQAQKNLDQEVHNYREEAQKQRKIIYQLEKDRDRYINETSSLRHKVQQCTDDIKVNETEISEYKKKTSDAEHRLTGLHNLYEAVISERNIYSKSLIEAQDEITELKRKLKFKNIQIEQLKEEISSKESTMSKEHQESQRVERENEGLKAKLQLMKQQAEETRQRIDGQKAEERQLQRTIADADAELARQKKELDQRAVWVRSKLIKHRATVSSLKPRSLLATPPPRAKEEAAVRKNAAKLKPPRPPHPDAFDMHSVAVGRPHGEARGHKDTSQHAIGVQQQQQMLLAPVAPFAVRSRGVVSCGPAAGGSGSSVGPLDLSPRTGRCSVREA
ncbi:unnamed protein product [Lota lota]